MLAGDFARKLRKLNKKLHIFCGNDDARAAGIAIVAPNGEVVEICGADKNYIPEFVSYKEDGRIFKSGWRRVLKILISKGLVNRQQAEKEFGTRVIGVRAPKRHQIKQDSLLSRLKDLGVDVIETGSY